MLSWWIHVIIHLSKHIECITPRVDPSMNYELGVIMTCPYGFFSYSKSPFCCICKGREYMENLSTFLSIWLWTYNCSKKLSKKKNVGFMDISACFWGDRSQLSSETLRVLSGMANHSSILSLEKSMNKGYSPWGRKESDMTEQLALSLSTPKSWRIAALEHFCNFKKFSLGEKNICVYLFKFVSLSPPCKGLSTSPKDFLQHKMGS